MQFTYEELTAIRYLLSAAQEQFVKKSGEWYKCKLNEDFGAPIWEQYVRDCERLIARAERIQHEEF